MPVAYFGDYIKSVISNPLMNILSLMTFVIANVNPVNCNYYVVSCNESIEGNLLIGH